MNEVQHDENRILIFFDATPNWSETPDSLDRLKEFWVSKIESIIEDISRREHLLPSFMTAEIGNDDRRKWWEAYMEAKDSFVLGHFRSAVSLAGIMAEGWVQFLLERHKIRLRDGSDLSLKDLIDPNSRVRHSECISALHKIGALSQEDHGDLNSLNKLRNNVMHRTVFEVTEEDARQAISLFLKVLQRRFDSKFTIKKGKIVPRERE